MKKLLLTTAIVFFVSMQCHRLHAQENLTKENDTTTSLEVVGLATEKGLPIDGIEVTLYKENEALEWDEITYVTNHNHHFSFKLVGNSYYSIKISKPGYVDRLISISTTIPDDVFDEGDVFKFEFDVELFKEIKGVDDYYFDFPVALITYNPKTDKFENSAKYTRHIKSKIYETAKTSGLAVYCLKH